MIAATLLAASLGANVVFTEDDFPFAQPDDHNTADIRAWDHGWFASYTMLTHRTEPPYVREDILELGYMPEGSHIGACVAVLGNLGGHAVQDAIHRNIGADPPTQVYDETIIRAGLWSRFSYKAGDVWLDGESRVYGDMAYAEAGAGVRSEWLDCDWRFRIFARVAWFADEERPASVITNEMGPVGAQASVATGHGIYTLQLCHSDCRWGLGWRF